MQQMTKGELSDAWYRNWMPLSHIHQEYIGGKDPSSIYVGRGWLWATHSLYLLTNTKDDSWVHGLKTEGKRWSTIQKKNMQQGGKKHIVEILRKTHACVWCARIQEEISGISLPSSTNKGLTVSAIEAWRRKGYLMLFRASFHEETEEVCWVWS